MIELIGTYEASLQNIRSGVREELWPEECLDVEGLVRRSHPGSPCPCPVAAALLRERPGCTVPCSACRGRPSQTAVGC